MNEWLFDRNIDKTNFKINSIMANNSHVFNKSIRMRIKQKKMRTNKKEVIIIIIVWDQYMA